MAASTPIAPQTPITRSDSLYNFSRFLITLGSLSLAITIIHTLHSPDSKANIPFGTASLFTFMGGLLMHDRATTAQREEIQTQRILAAAQRVIARSADLEGQRRSKE